MGLCGAISWGTACASQTLQEFQDIWANGQALYAHSDIEEKKEKIVSNDEAYPLHIHPTGYSELFVFRDYSFEYRNLDSSRLNLKIIPLTSEKVLPSMTCIFIEESFMRTAKVIAVVAVTILTSPLLVAVFIVSALCDFESTQNACISGWKLGLNRARSCRKFEFPAEPRDSHITPDDICKIGRALVGYRHVSTEELAQSNAQRGIPNGCSLNISFCDSESGYDKPAKFKALDRKIHAKKDVSSLIADYEQAITEFICGSIKMDFPNFQAVNYGDVFATLSSSRFMIVKTSWMSAADTFSYGRLGRFPKEYVAPENVTLLRRIKREEIGLLETKDTQKIVTLDEYEALIKYVASFYRKELFRYIREDFDPSTFQKNLIPLLEALNF